MKTLLFIGGIGTSEILVLSLFILFPLILFCALIIALIGFLNKKRNEYSLTTATPQGCGVYLYIYKV